MTVTALSPALAASITVTTTRHLKPNSNAGSRNGLPSSHFPITDKAMFKPFGHLHNTEISPLLNPTVDFLRSTGATPNYFGLGFIQMKFDETYRMHFWHPALSSVVAEEELHDHRYDFVSCILHGSTTHIVYDFVPDEAGDHGMYEVSCKPGDAREPALKGRGRVVRSGSYTMEAGSQYEFPHTQFHRIRARECITLVERREIVKEMATILKPMDTGHVCPFSQTIPQDLLWEYIAELVEDRVREPNGGYHLRPISKGVFGEVSKIEEELEEFKDALKQGNDIMALVELSDQLGAIRGWLERNHPSITIEKLITMNDATTRAFVNGHRN